MVHLICSLISQSLNHRSAEMCCFLELLIFLLNLREYLARLFGFSPLYQELVWSIYLAMVLYTQA